MTIDDLITGRVGVADIFSTAPWFTQDHLVRLTDTNRLFTAENVVPLVYRPGVNTTVINTLNLVSAKLTTSSLSNLDTEVILNGVSVSSAAQEWITEHSLGLDDARKGKVLSTGSTRRAWRASRPLPTS